MNIQNDQTEQEEFQERERREEKFKKAYPDGFSQISSEIEAMKQYGIYCGTCGHGNGCEHGVPRFDLRG